MSASRQRTFGLLLVALSTLVALVVAEVGLRLAEKRAEGGPLEAGELDRRLAESEAAASVDAGRRFSLYGLVKASSFEDVVYELKPNLAGAFRDRPIATNSFGLRGPEISRAKPPGTFRIVGLGDSHMFGWGVGQDETYLARLERRLDRSSAGETRFEVINCAVPGYNTTMEVATFEHKCAAFEPDLVVLHFVGNDFNLPHFLQPADDDEAASGDARDDHAGGAVERRAVGGSRLLAALLRLVGGAAPAAPGDGAADDDEIPALLPHGRRELPREARRRARRQYAHMRGADAFERAVERLAGLTVERGIPVLFLVLGESTGASAVAAEVARRNGLEVVVAGPTLAAHLESHGLEPSRAAWREAFQIPDDGHPSALAHRLYADLLSGVVRRRIERQVTDGRGPTAAPSGEPGVG